jgi:hypothetical protein
MTPRPHLPQEAFVTLRARRGFALPLALFFIGLMTVTLTASFMMTSGERRQNDGQAAQQRAYNNAAVGLEVYLGARGTELGLTGAPAVNEPEQVFAIAGNALDSAYVLTRRLRAESGTPNTPGYIPALYAVRSRGVYRGGRLPGVANAERSVGILATFQKGNMQVLAGWTSLTGLRKNGSAGILSGFDRCGAQAALAGVAVPNGGLDFNTPAMTTLAGNPPYRELGTFEEAAEQVNIDWDGIKNRSAIQADYLNQWPPDNILTNQFTTIHFENPPNATVVLRTGKGLLIVEGDLDLQGNTTWDGIILVGGNITSNGNNTVYGAVITGLDNQLGEDVINEDPSNANGTKIYQYDSCNVDAAVAALGALRPIRNTYIDNWRSF